MKFLVSGKFILTFTMCEPQKLLTKRLKGHLFVIFHRLQSNILCYSEWLSIRNDLAQTKEFHFTFILFQTILLACLFSRDRESINNTY